MSTISIGNGGTETPLAPGAETSPTSVFRVGTIAVRPSWAVQPVTSPLNIHRAAGMWLMKTVGEPLTIGTGRGAGGWAIPTVIAPEQATPCIMWAAGRASTSVGCGSGPAGNGTIAPEGASMSCVAGSVSRAAGNM